MNLYFTSKIRDCLDLFSSPMALEMCSGKICNGIVQFQIEIPKISSRRPRSVDEAELGHFKLLFCRGRQRNVQRFKTHVHRYRSLSLLFSDVLVAVVVVVCLSSQMYGNEANSMLTFTTRLRLSLPTARKYSLSLAR